MPDCQLIVEVLRRIRYGGPEWAHRWVTLGIPGQQNAWVLVYPLQDESHPRFDFMYTRKESPQEALSAMFMKHPKCTVLDWSPGRLACIQTTDVEVETLAQIIQDVAEVVWLQRTAIVDASYEEMGRA